MRTSLTAVLALLVIATTTAAQVCDYGSSVPLTERTYNGLKYEEGEYFVDATTGEERGCVCMKQPCMRKCCALGEGYDALQKRCVRVRHHFAPPVYDGASLQEGFNATQHFHLLFNKMNCSTDNKEFRIAVGSSTPDYHLQTDGRLYVAIENHEPPVLLYSPDKYCLDYFVSTDDGGGGTHSATVHLNGLICFVPKQEENHYALNAICMLVSCAFMVATVCVYAVVPALRSLPGRVLSAHLACFTAAFLLSAAMQLLLLRGHISQPACTAMTFVIYFSILAAFFWLNVLCYDLWSKFRQTNMMHGFRKSWRVRFMMYSAYAFGMPACLTVLLAALEFSGLPPSIQLLPHIRRKGCFIYGMSKLLYLYTPITVLCVVNLVLFVLTACEIAETKRQTQMLKRKDTQRLWLYIKLFLVTGVNWLLEVASALSPDVPYLWRLTDAYNLLLGLVIFLIFVCKKNIFMALRKRCAILYSCDHNDLDRKDTDPTKAYAT